MNEPSRRPHSGEDPQPTRRRFLKLGAMAAAAAGIPAPARAWLDPHGRARLDPSARARLDPSARRPAVSGRANAMPGRIVIYQDDGMEGQSNPINYEHVEQVVHHGVRLLTGVNAVGPAFESLFPGIHSGSTIAIKVNCIGPTDTRWETARGVVSGLSQMLGGTYDISQVTLYDRHNLGYHGYTPDRFTFNGHTAVISSTSSPSNYYVYGGHRLSSYIVNGDYVINIPALKSHSEPGNEITVAMKNHYGSCSPSSLCSDWVGMLTVNADDYVKSKTALVVTCALRGTYNGGPGTSPMYWSTYPMGTPNTLMFTTDPTTNEYWAREIINIERAAHSLPDKECPWIETSSQAPYELGISDPDDMTVLDPTDVSEDPVRPAGAVWLAAGAPNPFRDATVLRYHLGVEGPVRLRITDASGRIMRTLGRRLQPAGAGSLAWDGRDAQGRAVPAGVYFARLETHLGTRTRRVIKTR